MGSAAPVLSHLRRSLAGIDPNLAPVLPEDVRMVGLGAGIDAVLGGGLSCDALHELAPAAPVHLAAASGLALALAARSAHQRGETLWIATDFALSEGGGPYGPGVGGFGHAPEHFLMLRVPRPADALWAMEEALRCGALSSVIAELPGEGGDDLTVTRRLALAAREGRRACLGLLLRHGLPSMPSAAATRWHVAAAPGEPDRFGGLGATRFELSLVKNRRGLSGRWIVTWDHHEHVFHPSIPVGVAAAAFDRPVRALPRRTG